MDTKAIRVPERGSTDHRSLRQRWDPAYAAVAITLIGGIVYTFFRLAYASFYATFHTTPEEVGLNYSQTIVRGVIPSVTIVISVLIISVLVLIALISVIGYFVVAINTFRMSRRSRHHAEELLAQIANDPQRARSLDQYQDDWSAFWMQIKHRYPGTARIIANSYGWTDEQAISALTTAFAAKLTSKPRTRSSELNTFRMFNVMMAEAWRTCWGTLRHRATLLILLFATLIGLAVLIKHQADRVAEGHALGPSLTILTGLRAEEATVTAIDTSKNLPTNLTGRPVIYLGESNGIAVILIPHGGGSTVRVPLNQVVIQSQL